jgi:hypothetical protein
LCFDFPAKKAKKLKNSNKAKLNEDTEKFNVSAGSPSNEVNFNNQKTIP